MSKADQSMPTFRYRAQQPSGIPVFGTIDADDEPALRTTLQQRGLQLVQCSVVSLDASMNLSDQPLPRLYQLRVGERLREAWLTGLPAHEAVRAMAAEPFDHPLLSLMPLAFCLASAAILPAVGWLMLMPGSLTPLYLTAGAAFLVVPACWLIARERLHARPRRLLFALAKRLEDGEPQALQMTQGLPVEVRAILSSSVDDQRKAMAVSDLVPALMGSRFHMHRLLLTLFGSFVLLLVAGLGFYWAMWQIVPQFRAMFDDFGVSLPFITQAIVQLSELFSVMGTTGFVVSCLVSAGLLLLLYMGLSGGPLTELISHTPLLGIPFRWLMQARVARVLAAMLRYDCDRAAAVRAATSASSWNAVAREGERLALSLNAGQPLPEKPRYLSGLPMSLLSYRSESSQNNRPQETAGIAQSFNAMAEMLEQASQGQGRFLGMVLQMGVTIFAGLLIGIIVVALFLPLVKLLNDLS